MSELTVRNPTSGWLGGAAVMLAAGALLSYGLALSIDEGFYTICGVLGIAAFAAGRRGRRSLDRGPANVAVLLATIVGGLAAAVVIVCSIVVGITHLV